MRAALLVLALLFVSPLAAAEPVPCGPGVPSNLGVAKLTCDETTQGEHTQRTTRLDTSIVIIGPIGDSQTDIFVRIEHAEINGEGATCRVEYWAPNGPGPREVRAGQPCPGQTPPNPTPPTIPEVPETPELPVPLPDTPETPEPPVTP